MHFQFNFLKNFTDAAQIEEKYTAAGPSSVVSAGENDSFDGTSGNETLDEI